MKIKRIIFAAIATGVVILLASGCKKQSAQITPMTYEEAFNSVIALWINRETDDQIQFNKDKTGTIINDDGIEQLTFDVTPSDDGTADVKYTYEGRTGHLILPEKDSKILKTANGVIYDKYNLK